MEALSGGHGAPVTESKRAWPLTGRDDELQLIVGVMSPAPGVVVLAGASGVGKTRLAAEAMALLRSRGWVTREAVATESAASIPFGALAHLLPASHPPGANALEILSEASRGFGGEGLEHQLALWVDDAHLLDKASAALIHRLALDRSVSLLLTMRAGSAAPDPVTALWKDGLASRLDLQGLSDEEVGRLLGAGLGGYIAGGTLDFLTRAAAGNVLYLHELVLSGLSAGTLSQKSGIWRCSGPIAPGAGLTELVEERLAGLAPAQRRLLEALALGEPLDPDLFQRLAPADVVESAEDSGLVAAVDSAGRLQVRVAHPLYAEVLRKGIPPLRARALLRRLAEGVEAVEGPRPEGVLRSSVLRLRSGQRIAADRAVTAARRAVQLGDYRLAGELIRSAEADVGIAGRMVLGEALVRQHREVEAERLLSAEVPAGDVEVARLAMVRASNLAHGLGRPEEAIAILVASEERAVDRAARDELASTRALFLALTSSPGSGLSVAGEVMERPAVGPVPLGRARTAAAYVLTFAGRPAQALRLLDIQAPGRLAGDGGCLVLGGRSTALMLAGRFEAARQLAQEQYDAAIREGREASAGYWAFVSGMEAPYTGCARAAMDRLREAIAVLRTADPQYALASAFGALAQTAALGGDVTTGGQALGDMEAQCSGCMPLQRAMLELSRGWMAAAGGEMVTACRHALAAAEVCGQTGRHGLEALALLHVARFGDPVSAWTRLRERDCDFDGVLLPAVVRYVGALHARDAIGLCESAAAFESMGAFLVAGEAATHAALAYMGSGRMGSARTWQLAARALLDRCGGVRAPTLPSLDMSGVLTRREREVAGLAARGLTSPQIACRLSISVRTVDNHLQQVFSKLEVRGRHELPAELGSSVAE